MSDSIVHDERLNTWIDIVTHPHFADDATDAQVVALYDRLLSANGYVKASSLWRAACNYMDHLALDHGGGDCDCDFIAPQGPRYRRKGEVWE